MAVKAERAAMKLGSEWISYDSPAGQVAAYLATASGPLPGVGVIHEVWGIDGHIADLAERPASADRVDPDLY